MEGGLQLYDGEIRVKDAEGKFVAQFKPEHYLSHMAEHVEPWSFLKFPYYRKLGWPKGTYRVGPAGADERGRQDRHAPGQRGVQAVQNRSTAASRSKGPSTTTTPG